MNYIKQLDYKIIMLVSILMGLTGGYEFLSSGVEFIGKALFSFYGLIIGIVIGLAFTMLANSWGATQKVKNITILAFVLFSVGPMCWAYFDFEEHINSNKGLVTMLVIDLVALIILFLWTRNEKRKLIPVLLIIPVWQLISLVWFICMTWKEMNYWD